MKNRKKSMKYASALIVAAAVILAAVYFVIADSKTEKTVWNDFTPAEITLAVIEEEIDETEEPEKTAALTWEISNTDTYSADKPVSVLNVDETDVNNADAYIRVAIVPKWTSAATVTVESQTDSSGAADSVNETETTEAEEICVDIITDNYGLTDFGKPTFNSESSFTMGDVTFILADDWSENWIYNSTDGYFYYRDIVEPGEATAQLLEAVQISAEVYQTISAYDIQLGIDILADSIQTQGGALDARWSNSGIEISDDGTLQLTEST